MKTNLSVETWKPVPGWDGHSVSSEGRVRRVFKSTSFRILRAHRSKGGYLVVNMKEPARRQTANVHELVLLAFVGPRPSQNHCAAHRNGLRHDSRLANLRWATYKQNSDDARRHGTQAKGEFCGGAKLTYQSIVEISFLRALGIASQNEVAEAYGISDSAVGLIENSKRWKHVAISPQARKFIRLWIAHRALGMGLVQSAADTLRTVLMTHGRAPWL